MRTAVGVAALSLTLGACGWGAGEKSVPLPPPKRFPAPIFDGLSLGMSREAVERLHSIRSSLTAGGRNRRVWIYDRPGEYAAELTFSSAAAEARLARIDIHFGPSDSTSEQFIARFEATLGAPEARRRKAAVNAYGDQAHEQYDTIWSDADQYVYLTERVPERGGRRPVYFLTVKRKEIKATGPPTGYVPPPPPKGKDGKPIDEAPF
jgi:hypothetical protein